jgi:hypothetical protein
MDISNQRVGRGGDNGTQMQGRNELFDCMAGRQREIAETDGWAGYVLACAEAGM